MAAPKPQQQRQPERKRKRNVGLQIYGQEDREGIEGAPREDGGGIRCAVWETFRGLWCGEGGEIEENNDIEGKGSEDGGGLGGRELRGRRTGGEGQWMAG